jgi:hypothetical protein
MSPEQRTHFHQVKSWPRMKDLDAWFKKQFAERKVEPNSGLSEAILYMQKYWDKLTLFLRQARAPLDNKIVEQTLKMAILHRKNELFYKTQKGARVGDLFMRCGLHRRSGGACWFPRISHWRVCTTCCNSPWAGPTLTCTSSDSAGSAMLWPDRSGSKCGGGHRRAQSTGSINYWSGWSKDRLRV